jgi:magnesium transporter
MRLLRKRTKTVGLPPGTPVYVGTQRVEKPRITIIDYDRELLEEKEVAAVEECRSLKDSSTVSWINVDGVHEVEVVSRLGEYFGLHPLVIEDIVNTSQRPKMEDFEDYIFIVLKMLRRTQDGEVDAEQVSIILGPNFVISFQERPGDVFEPVRERIRKAKGRIRKMGADYLAYALLDAVVDGYFTVFEPYGDKTEDLADELVGSPRPESLQTIHRLKRELIFLRRSVWPLRELLSNLVRTESGLVKKQTGLFLRDVYDHTIQIIDTIESLRDTVSGMLDIYLSSISNRMNEVMKVLTVIATIFIPLTFVAGIYGMNFDFMPELHWAWGYFGALGVMAAVAVVMVLYFRRKRWL